ncbi:NADH:flavin oxidoreductase/NADH oxidase family protein [Salinibius halmophilus]|uniref:NADH:flavin oxidoreductase/NADH oxidase family protein n=1 Tax=Salinibius halmophilus TaxID=1853216 RepID=UPI000E67147A|nr:NADH:flavin oxidoreductase/NADH oxidase family protein [Salinibius halmophilus]
MSVFSEFTIADGLTVKNRIVKAAMEENLAGEQFLPSDGLINLYRTWAKGGTGMLITGNVMVDHRSMTGPGGVALEAHTDLTRFKQWAQAGQENGCKMMMQISHPGRQIYAALGGKVVAPSAVALEMGGASKMFAMPTPMTEDEIEQAIEHFAITASKAKQAGFDAVQVHGAHGYLVAQFLSPLSNQRDDQWGGSLQNRARFLLAIVARIKDKCGPDFPVAVKLNSADFQRGGFDVDDAKLVAKWLEKAGVCLIELSGGSYESPAMQGDTADQRTLAREAYFLEFAKEMRQSLTVPLMTTGGIRRLPVAQNVVVQGIELVGVASALAYCPDLPNQWQQQADYVAPVQTASFKSKSLRGMANMMLVSRQLGRMAAGKPVKQVSPVVTLAWSQWRMQKLVKRYKKQLG